MLVLPGTAGGGGGATNTGSAFISLKPLAQRAGVTQVIARLRRKLAAVPGATLFLQAVQDIRVGGRQSNAEYEYTLSADSTADHYRWGPRLTALLQHDPNLADVNSDQQQSGISTNLVIDRSTASRLGLTPSQIDNTLYDAFGQRQVSVIYSAQDQYHVIMEVAPRWWQDPQTLRLIYVSTAGATASGTGATQLGSGSVTASAGSGSTSGTSGTGSSGASGTTSTGGTSSGAVSAVSTTGFVGRAARGPQRRLELHRQCR